MILGRQHGQWMLMTNIYFIFITYIIDTYLIHVYVVEKVLIYFVKLATFKCESEIRNMNLLRIS